MKRLFIVLPALLMLAGCAGHRMTGYNLKANVGNTSYDDGHNAFFTGGSIDAHFETR